MKQNPNGPQSTLPQTIPVPEDDPIAIAHKSWEQEEEHHALTEGAPSEVMGMEPSKDASSLSNTGLTYLPMLDHAPVNYISVKNLVHLKENKLDLTG